MDGIELAPATQRLRRTGVDSYGFQEARALPRTATIQTLQDRTKDFGLHHEVSVDTQYDMYIYTMANHQSPQGSQAAPAVVL